MFPEQKRAFDFETGASAEQLESPLSDPACNLGLGGRCFLVIRFVFVELCFLLPCYRRIEQTKRREMRDASGRLALEPLLL